MIKRLISSFLIVTLVMSVFSGCAAQEKTDTEEVQETDAVKIGVSIWSSSDVQGSRCKDILCEAADVMGIELVFVDTGLSGVIPSVKQLIDEGCDGIIVCNSATSEMSEVIQACTESKVYLAQFFRTIDQDRDSEIYDEAKSSPYYVGAVHEDEIENGQVLMDGVLEAGARNVAVVGIQDDDSAWIDRYDGFVQSINTWNEKNPLDHANIADTYYAGATADGGREAALAITEKGVADAVICAGGGGEPLLGMLSEFEIEENERILAASGFIDDLGDRIKSGEILLASGGNYCDPMFALMMVYSAIEGGEDLSVRFNDVTLSYMFINSYNEFDEYREYFDFELPYTDEEIAELFAMSPKQLFDAAQKLSIEDAAKRAEKREP